MLNRFSYNEYSFENATCFTVVDAPAAVECSRQFNQNPRANVKVGQPANLPPTTTSIVVANYVGFNTGASWVLDKPFARLETLLGASRDPAVLLPAVVFACAFLLTVTRGLAKFIDGSECMRVGEARGHEA